MYPDADGDGIADIVEYPQTLDTDRDGTPDYLDLDSDNDTLSDYIEGSRDPDRDSIGNFRDPDSDNDGLSDKREKELGTNFEVADSDGDGVSDLIEVVACTDPSAECSNDALAPTWNPRVRGQFVFVMPFNGVPEPETDTLQFTTNLRRGDIYFLMDNTSSMQATIESLQRNLRRTLIPALRENIPEAWFGAGGFDDYPILPPGETRAYGVQNVRTDSFGVTHDAPFFQYTEMTYDDIALQAAVNAYGVNNGDDEPESGVAALYALATRDTLSAFARFPGISPSECSPDRRRGAACFRDDAVPIIVMMTDADQHNSPTCAGCDYDNTVVPGGGPSYLSAVQALSELEARVVGIATDPAARPFLERLVQDVTLANGASGVPSDYVIGASNGTGLPDAIVAAITRAAAVPIDATAFIVDLYENEEVNSVAAFVDHLEANTDGVATDPSTFCVADLPVSDRPQLDDDSYADTFDHISPGTTVCYDIVLKTNTAVMPTGQPQLYRASIQVLGNGFSPLDAREVFFLVPPVVTVDVLL